jgi:hypothetical protein
MNAETELEAITELCHDAERAGRETVDVSALRAVIARRRKRSAIEPQFSDIMQQLEEKLSALTESLEGSREVWEEWDEHCSTWQFRPEALTADLISAAMLPEIRAYVAANPPIENLDEHEGRLLLTQEWCEAYLLWLLAHPMAARLLRIAVSDACCFMVRKSSVDNEFVHNVKQDLLDFIEQTNYEPFNACIGCGTGQRSCTRYSRRGRPCCSECQHPDEDEILARPYGPTLHMGP